MSYGPMPLQVKMALGRLFAAGGRPSQPGDTETFAAIRAIVLDAAEQAVGHAPLYYEHNYQRDRLRGASGD